MAARQVAGDGEVDCKWMEGLFVSKFNDLYLEWRCNGLAPHNASLGFCCFNSRNSENTVI